MSHNKIRINSKPQKILKFHFDTQELFINNNDDLTLDDIGQKYFYKDINLDLKDIYITYKLKENSTLKKNSKFKITK